MKSKLSHLSNEVNAIIGIGNKEYSQGHLEGAVNYWERALSLLSNAKVRIKGLNVYAAEHINKAQRRLRINIRNVTKSIKEEIRVKNLLDAPTEIYCQACGCLNDSDRTICKQCGTPLRTIGFSSTDQQDDLLEKCESPIERQFFTSARKLIPNLEPQEWIGKYRVDFALKDKKVVVELDGHSYHKTKEQRQNDAERQRHLQKEGYTVIRFTGSEINKDLSGCISEVLDILDKKSNSK